MQLPPSSQGWADRITWLVYGIVGTGGAAALLNSIFNRKKQPSEIAKLDAETEQTEAETTVKLSAQLVMLHDRLNRLEATMDYERREAMELRREATETRFYYREQLTYFEALDNAYRRRSHDHSGLFQELIAAMFKLQAIYAQETGKEPPPVTVTATSWDDVVKAYPLPSPPAPPEA